jgi:hypothetical protein
MTDRQLSLPFPTAEVPCRTCLGKGDVYSSPGGPTWSAASASFVRFALSRVWLRCRY